MSELLINKASKQLGNRLEILIKICVLLMIILLGGHLNMLFSQVQHQKKHSQNDLDLLVQGHSNESESYYTPDEITKVSKAIFRENSMYSMTIADLTVSRRLSVEKCKLHDLNVGWVYFEPASNFYPAGVVMRDDTINNFNINTCDLNISTIDSSIFTKFEIQSVEFAELTISNSIFKNCHLFGASNITFNHCFLPDTVFLNACSGDIRLRNMPNEHEEHERGNKKIHYINLYYSSPENFDFDYNNIKLDLTNPETHQPLNSDEVEKLYAALERGYVSRQEFLNVENLNIDREDYRVKQIPILGYFVWIIHHWNCYGYHREWIFLWTLILPIIFTIFSAFMYKALNNPLDGVYPIKNIPYLSNNYNYKISKSFFSKALDKVAYSFLWTACVFFLLRLDIKNINFLRKRYVLYLLVVYIAGIIDLAYIAAYILH